jgi:hypothetical protein
MFGSDAQAAAIALPTRPLHQMYAEPAREYIERRGGTVLTGAAAKIRVRGDDVTVETTINAESDEKKIAPRSLRSYAAGRVISAVPWFALADLFDAIPTPLADLVARARALVSCPIVTVNLWFDRPLLDEPFIGLPGRTMQWVFDKRLTSGDDASHLSLVSSGASAIVGKTNEELVAVAHQELIEAIPDARRAKLRRSTVVREPRATFSLAPGQPARPHTETGLKRLLLAGDWIDTGLPATIESAVRSGHMAAACIG